MKESIILISHIRIIVLGLIAIILSNLLPKKVILLDEKRFVVNDKNEYEKLKRKQLKNLGIYYIIVGMLLLTIVKSTILSMILLFLMPGLVITKMENKLKELYKVRIN